MRESLTSFALLCMLVGSSPVRGANYDVVIYGGTSAGVIAAVQAKKMGRSTVIVGPDVTWRSDRRRSRLD